MEAESKPPVPVAVAVTAMANKYTSTGEELYFAYGSNLSPTQMKERCPGSTPIGLAHLPGWTWIINERGYANIVQINTDRDPDAPKELSETSPVGHKTDGKANGQSAAAHGVYGVLYRLDPTDKATLDVYEGVPWSYERQFVEAIWVEGPDAEKGQKVTVLAYVDYLRVTPDVPRPEYIVRMNSGIDEALSTWKLPQTYVQEVMRPFIPNDNGEA
ncbi:Uu.00g032990.m01.CDS01 [Anthostomella pinea]|uniref:gamma-glutamylcyclotransferase n=1 Tax=Anthostomella pinea TaxID=933095 RepID=A0AAI8YD50_9PEZI|nr:Uu.00g032990.m01.CDS01 [Anthostomella pinea]